MAMFSILHKLLTALAKLLRPNAANFWNLKTKFFAVAPFSVFAIFAAHADTGDESAVRDHVRVSWLAPKTFTNATTHIGIEFSIDPEWHVYWKNPGDSGAAPKFRFLAQGAAVSDVLWPVPKRLPIAHLTNLGYETNIVFLVPVNVHPKSNSIHLTAQLEWLVCKVECIPGFATLKLTRPVGQTALWPVGFEDKLNKFIRHVPIVTDNTSAQSSSWQVGPVIWRPPTATLQIHNPSTATAAPEVFPVSGNFLQAKTPQVLRTSHGWDIVFNTQPISDSPQTLAVVLQDTQSGRSWEFLHVPVTLSLTLDTTTAPVGDGSISSNKFSLLILLISAFIGGIVLNLMPCVLPMLSIKLLSLTHETAASRRVRSGLLYACGVVLAFASLGGLTVFLRATGHAVGWGFHLQSPAVVAFLIVLFWLLSLNFLSLFNFGDDLMAWAGSQSTVSSLGSGVLSVFVAAPCTGPFMGAALGAGLTLPPLITMGIFVSLGLGLASPFLLLVLSPRLLKLLPRPGLWMSRLKLILALPLLATVVWLLWVLWQQTSLAMFWLTAIYLGLLLAFIKVTDSGGDDRKFSESFLGHIFSTFRQARRSVWSLAFLGLILIMFGAQNLRLQGPQSVNKQADSKWQVFSPQRVSELRTQGQAVFIDFTAAWCISCQVNKQLVLNTDAAQKLFTKYHVTLLRADWTNFDPVVTQALAEYGRNSIPLYVYYAPQAEAVILPQILTLSEIEKLF